MSYLLKFEISNHFSIFYHVVNIEILIYRMILNLGFGRLKVIVWVFPRHEDLGPIFQQNNLDLNLNLHKFDLKYNLHIEQVKH